jgi:hypothetical protein
MVVNLNGWQGFPGFDNLGDNAFNQYKWEGQVSLWKYLRSFKLSYQFG